MRSWGRRPCRWGRCAAGRLRRALTRRWEIAASVLLDGPVQVRQCRVVAYLLLRQGGSPGDRLVRMTSPVIPCRAQPIKMHAIPRVVCRAGQPEKKGLIDAGANQSDCKIHCTLARPRARRHGMRQQGPTVRLRREARAASARTPAPLTPKIDDSTNGRRSARTRMRGAGPNVQLATSASPRRDQTSGPDVLRLYARPHRPPPTCIH